MCEHCNHHSRPVPKPIVKTNKPKMFRVYANSKQRFYLDVEASDMNEAYNIAYETDGGEFTEDNEGDWEIEDNAEEIK